jgi:hypothetical protein
VGYKEEAMAEVRRLADTGEPFTSDDLHDVLDHPDLLHTPNARNNIIGQVFRQARALGLIEPVGVTQSQQPHRKGGMVRIWQKRKRRLVRVGGSHG